jgi:hypothetical protein
MRGPGHHAIRGGSTTVYRTIGSRLPGRRPALAAGAAAVLAAACGTAVAPAAQASPTGPYTGGTSTATVLRAGLDVSLLHATVEVPVNASLNDVHAPAGARRTALTVTVGHGVEGGRPVDLLRARAATAEATADGQRAQGVAELTRAAARPHGTGDLAATGTASATPYLALGAAGLDAAGAAVVPGGRAAPQGPGAGRPRRVMA